MRFRGREYSGKGVTVAVVDSGIDVNDPRLAGASIEGWSIQLGATGHAMLSGAFHDEHGHGTEMAAAIHALAPEAKIVGVKIMGNRLRTSAELMAAGIETASRHGCRVINLSLGTPNMGKALLLRDCCANAVEAGSLVLAAAHPKGERAYPADLPETVGVASHPDCPLDKFFYFDQRRFTRKAWGVLSGKFLAHGWTGVDGTESRYVGSGLATAHMSGFTACIAEAMVGRPATDVLKSLERQALVPAPEIGYG